MYCFFLDYLHFMFSDIYPWIEFNLNPHFVYLLPLKKHYA
jgi:hypothetical protein